MTEEQTDWLKRRIQRLRSRQKSVGPFRQAEIERTIQGMKRQLREGVWQPKESGHD